MSQAPLSLLGTPGGVEVHLQQTTRFKTVHLHWLLEAPLDAGRTARAVLPDLLTRGTASYPELSALSARCEELYNKSRRQRSLEFIVDVIAFEMSRALRSAHERKWPVDVQTELLRFLLTIDRQPRLADTSDAPETAISLGVRLVQVGLERYVHPYLFDPILLNILLWPAWLVAGVPAILILLLARRRRQRRMFT